MACADLSVAFNTHEDCSSILGICTTTGAGCITKGSCDTYQTADICRVARTTEPGETCIWDRATCRRKECNDAPRTNKNNASCSKFLKGCIWNGSSCIESNFSCSMIITAASCLQEFLGRPCLWAFGACYGFSRCEDLEFEDHDLC